MMTRMITIKMTMMTMAMIMIIMAMIAMMMMMTLLLTQRRNFAPSLPAGSLLHS